MLHVTFLTLLRALEVNIDLRHVNHIRYYYYYYIIIIIIIITGTVTQKPVSIINASCAIYAKFKNLKILYGFNFEYINDNYSQLCILYSSC